MSVKRPGWRLTVARVVGALGLAIAVAEGAAGAHPEPAPAGTNRYVTATVAGGQVEIADLWLEGPLAAIEERRHLDSDGDGRVDARELVGGRDAARAAALAVTLDGVAAAATADVTIDLGGDAAVGPAPVAIERRVTVALADRRDHVLRIELARDPPRPVTTEMALDLEPGYTLPGGPAAARAVLRGPRHSALEDRSITFAFTGPPARGAAPRDAAIVVIALATGTALAGAHRRRRWPSGSRIIEGAAHAAFPLVVGGLLAYARERLWPEMSRAQLAAAALVVAGLAFLAGMRRPNEDEGGADRGHDDLGIVGRIVPSEEMVSLAVMGALLPAALSAPGALAFGAALALRRAQVPRRARVVCAVVAALAAAGAVALAQLR